MRRQFEHPGRREFLQALAGAAALALPRTTGAQAGPSASKLGERITLITGAGNNVLALAGESGLIAWAGEKRRLAALETELAETRATLARLEDRAARLRDETLDLDYLDERARALLGMGRPGEIVVPAAALEG